MPRRHAMRPFELADRLLESSARQIRLAQDEVRREVTLVQLDRLLRLFDRAVDMAGVR